MDFAKIRELLKGLVNDSLPTEEVEKIGGIVQEVDNSEKEFNEFVVKHDDLRKKYIEAVKTSAFQEKPQDEPEQPKTLEECLKAEIAKRKDEYLWQNYL